MYNDKNIYLMIGVWTLLFSCIASPWATNLVKFPAINSDYLHQVGLWQSCSFVDINDNEVSISAQCKSTAKALDKTAVYAMRTMAILSILLGLVAVYGVMNNKFSEYIFAISGMSAVFALATIVTFSINLKKELAKSSFGASYYTQIIGIILMVIFTVMEMKKKQMF